MLASATKSNALQHSMVLWDEVAESMRADYPGVAFRKYVAEHHPIAVQMFLEKRWDVIPGAEPAADPDQLVEAVRQRRRLTLGQAL